MEGLWDPLHILFLGPGLAPWLAFATDLGVCPSLGGECLMAVIKEGASHQFSQGSLSALSNNEV